ncbi:MAG: NAD(P)/FAD-dependent oxidoreductase [Patescibacteria group bacterium]|jgi:dihydrolipoamide dehydrogenase
MYDYDVIILGGGPAGCACAIELAKQQKKVAIVEQQAIGGTCLNHGCIPTKSYLYTVELLNNIKKAQRFGLKIAEPEIIWEDIKKKKDLNVKVLGLGLKNTLQQAGVTIINGFGKLVDDHIVEVSDKKLSAEYMVLATGTKPLFIPGIIPGEHVISSTEILNLDKIPASLTIIGGGVIGVEIASVFCALGTPVTIIEKAAALLGNMDQQISEQLKNILQKKGCKILLNTTVASCTDKNNQAEIIYDNDKVLSTDKALVVIGRKANTDLKVVNNNLQTNKPNIYIIGDAAGKTLTAYGGEKEGECVAKHIINQQDMNIDYANMPITVFSQPEVAAVGLTEAQAIKLGLNIVVKTSTYAANAKAMIMGEREGLVKIIVEQTNQKILGVHIIGSQAVDLIHQAIIPVTKGMTIADWKEVTWSHPVLSEVIKAAL